jgi:hypothetical protein
MSNPTKNHHRKKKKNATDEPGYQPAELTKDSSLKKQPSDTAIHLGDATLQTPEEHEHDQNVDPKKNDNTEIPR